ncbi:hypothetical protein HM1_1493 [Heliomicrobium modesticaldum Ice1]|uniref:Phage holin, LL-H family n=1 Tax=Heliobacterium modesticaldum (strain ATCC 51547 / Ice1) TaxID=498761 RepID=B0TCP0_HELMI|nr:phage holin, LLH family [Heliomicrobium modesticaldum]ABZ84066.1 hypothetical protein HM1_1493 [Heliomicrobium modesticaldum Ice1]
MDPNLFLLGLFVIVFGVMVTVTFAIRSCGPALVEFMKSATIEQQRQTATKLAQSAVVFARARFGALSGKEQFEKALLLVSNALAEKGLQVSSDELASTVEFAYEEAKKAGLVVSLSELKKIADSGTETPSSAEEAPVA